MSKHHHHDPKDWSKVREDADHSRVDAGSNEHEAVEPVSQDTLALDHPSYRALEEELTLAEKKAHENWEKFERAQADMENIRRRAERDVTQAHRYGLEKFAHALLPVVDSLDQALQMTTAEAVPAVHEGLVLTMKLFLDVLNKFEIKALDPLGEVFDPEQHEAMSVQPSQEVAPNTVVAVFQKGYTLHGRVIRPARVVVSKEK